MPCCHRTLISKKPNDPAYPIELKTIGDHVRARRLDLGLYQKALARQLSVTTNTITNWEKNRSTPDLRTWPAVLRFLGYDPRPAAHGIGEQLRRHRQGLGLSWAEAAGIMGVDPSTLFKWERGIRSPGPQYSDIVRRFLESS